MQLLMVTQEKNLLRELEDENMECDRVILEHDNILFDSSSKIKEAVLRKAYNINILIKNYPNLYDFGPESIFSAIMSEYQRKGVSKTTLRTIYKAFEDPEYDIYKTHVYNTAKRRQTEQLEQAQGEKYIIDIQMQEHIEFMNAHIDHPRVQSWLQQQAKAITKKEVREKKELEDEEKITLPRPEWLPPGVEGQESLTSNAAQKLSKAWHNIAIRIYQYPPKSKQDDKFYAEGIETMHALIVPGTDLKYVRDTLSYLDITLEKETQSVHSAMSKSKILTPSGKYRKVTREQIADIAPQMILLSIHIVENIPGFIKFCLYLLREQKPYSGEFHLNRHDKLSESAFGKSSLMP